MSSDTLIIAWTTVRSDDEAHALARMLVENKLAACVQVDGPVQSHYEWQGKLCCDDECRLMIKTPKAKLEELTRFIHAHHPYETPQWLAVEADSVGPAYLEWTAKVTQK